MKLFETLPKEIQDDVKSTLKAYDGVEVTFYDNDYHVQTYTCLLAKYPKDFKTFGTIKKSDIFTNNEMIENYINTFNEYPAEYKGKRSYPIIDGTYKINSNGDLILI